MSSLINWPVYHLYDVSDNDFENFSHNKLSLCCAGHGVLCFESTEGTDIKVMHPNDEEDVDSFPKSEQQELVLIKLARSSQLALFGLAPGPTFPNKNFLFQIVNTHTLTEEGRIEIPNFDVKKGDNDIVLSISPNLDHFAFTKNSTDVWVYSAPYRKEQKPFIFKTKEPVTNIFMTNNNIPSDCNLFIITETKMYVYYKTDVTSKDFTSTAQFNAGCLPKHATVGRNNNADEIIIMCNDDVLTFYDVKGPREFNGDDQHEGGDDKNDKKEEEEDSTEKEEEESKNEQSSSLSMLLKRKKSPKVVEMENNKKAEERKRIILDGKPKSIYWCNNAILGLYDTFNGKKEGTVRVYNFEPPCIFGKANNGDKVRYVFYEWNSIVLVMEPDPNPTSEVITPVLKLAEVEMDEKIQQIIKNEQFDVALSIARSHHMKADAIADIHRKRGDSYHSKHKYNEAIKAYIKTIKYLEPSYVITRFIDPQMAEYLIKYLEALMRKGVANKQHTTLLFNCYTKLQKTDKLKSMVDKNCSDAQKGRLNAPFDVDTAVQVLALNGFRKEALKLARSYKKHMFYTSMLAEEKRYEEIFEHIKTLGPKALTEVVQRHGFDLMDSYENEEEWRPFVQYIAECCVVGAPLDPKLRKELGEEGDHKPKPEAFLRIFILKPEALMLFLRLLIDGLNGEGDASMEIWDATIESGVALLQGEGQRKWFDKYYTDDNANFNIEQLIVFLKSEGFVHGLKKLYTHPEVCFYEEILNLTEPERIPDLFRDTEPVAVWRSRKNLWRYALKRLVTLSAKARSEKNSQEVLKIEHAIEDMLKLVAAARIKAEERAQMYYDPDYYIKSLDAKEAAAESEVNEDSDDSIDVELIDGNISPQLVEPPDPQEDDISGPISYLEILDVLAIDKRLPLRLIKNLSKIEFKARQDRIIKLTELEQETEKSLVEKDNLAERLVQCHYKAKQTRCTKCHGVIDLPAKHFLCGHSYHMEHLGENINMCLECEAKQKAVLEKKQKSLQNALSRFQAPEKTIVSSPQDPLYLLSTIMQTDVMNPNDLFEQCQKVTEELKEYQN